MNKSYFGGLVKKIKSSEKAEIMPAAIITAIVSSVLLLGITIVMSLVFQSKAEQTNDVELATVVSNIDVSLRSDITQASFISVSAKLTQPDTRLLSSDDIRLNGINLHIPASSGECKIVKWSIDGTTLSRQLTHYAATLTEGKEAKCDESSGIVSERNKEFKENFLLQAPFGFTNHVGRELTYTLDDLTLTKVNDELEHKLTVQSTDKLSDADFNKLNKFVNSDNLVRGFADNDTCVMDEDKVDGVCPVPESASLGAAWNSTAIAKVSLSFEMMGDSGEVVHRDIEQASSISLR